MARVPHDQRRVTDGGRELRAWLDEHGISVPVFCEAHGLNRITVQRLLNGEQLWVSVDLAWSIQQATKGGVLMPAWLSATARPPRKDEIRKPGRRAGPKKEGPMRRSDARSAGRARGRSASAVRSAARARA